MAPLLKATAPFFTSHPLSRTPSPFSGECLRRRVSPSASMSSCFTTASAPAGMSAPVMMRSARPFSTDTSGTWPATAVPIILSSTGWVAAAERVSSTLTAYPSNEEYEKGGKSPGAITSTARVRSRASTRDAVSTGPGFTFSLISSLASASDITGSCSFKGVDMSLSSAY